MRLEELITHFQQIVDWVPESLYLKRVAVHESTKIGNHFGVSRIGSVRRQHRGVRAGGRSGCALRPKYFVFAGVAQPKPASVSLRTPSRFSSSRSSFFFSLHLRLLFLLLLLLFLPPHFRIPFPLLFSSPPPPSSAPVRR